VHEVTYFLFNDTFDWVWMFEWGCKRDVSSFVLIHIHPARLFGNANAKEKDSISGECSQRGSDDVMAKQ